MPSVKLATVPQWTSDPVRCSRDEIFNLELQSGRKIWIFFKLWSLLRLRPDLSQTSLSERGLFCAPTLNQWSKLNISTDKKVRAISGVEEPRSSETSAFWAHVMMKSAKCKLRFTKFVHGMLVEPNFSLSITKGHCHTVLVRSPTPSVLLRCSECTTHSNSLLKIQQITAENVAIHYIVSIASLAVVNSLQIFDSLRVLFLVCRGPLGSSPLPQKKKLDARHMPSLWP